MRVGGDVKERDVESHEAEEKARSAEQERHFAKGGDIEKFPAGGGKYALPHDEVGDAESEQRNESDDSSCPAKTDPGL